VQHGLTATTLLPDLIGSEALQCCYDRLHAEWRPTSPTQEFLVRELARHVAALKLVEHAETAVLRCGADSVLGILHPGEGACVDIDRCLAATITTEALDRTTRYRRAHEKGYYTALLRLREAKSTGPFPSSAPTPSKVSAFASEEACRTYLLTRLRQPDYQCPQCRHARGSWIAARQRWQCYGCRRQHGLRAGSVMAGSPLRLITWFRAIRCLVLRPNAATHDLATEMGVRRLATVRRVAETIRAALLSPRATELLAGLDEVFRMNS